MIMMMCSGAVVRIPIDTNLIALCYLCDIKICTPYIEYLRLMHLILAVNVFCDVSSFTQTDKWFLDGKVLR